MPLLTLRDLTVRFRGPPLLDEVSCLIEPGQKIGLLGRNGSGKTTLMRILCGEVEPDHGEVTLAPGAKLAMLQQEVPRGVAGTVAEVVAGGLTLALGAGRDKTSDRSNEKGGGQSPRDAHDPHDELHPEGWKAQQAVERILSRMELDGAATFDALSAGMKRRVLLARALVGDPDCLLLDEPTNHLDIEAIGWLEDFLVRWPGTLIFVTHDRMFLQRLATRILELDRGRLFDWSCDYPTFLRRKEEALAAEEKQNALFDKRLAEEEVWIRQGIKARRTRNEGRVRALEAMRRERADRREKQGRVKLEIQESSRSGVLVAQLDNVTFSYGERPILKNFSTMIARGDKIGIIGPNGAGKTTLLRVLLGQLPPQQGTVRSGSNLQIAYFDQLRGQLGDDKTVEQDVGDGYDTVKINGQSRHIIGYLRDFLFTPERARTPVRFLSGGERNRVLLAKLFAKPANVIVLDEPTNDLDTETLELLEERLVEYDGTVLVVSHDRAFLNNVVTSTIVFEPTGVREYAGGYDDWARQRAATAAAVAVTGDSGRRRGSDGAAGGRSNSADTPAAGATQGGSSTNGGNASSGGSSSGAGAGAGSPPVKRKLTYKEQQELNGLPAKIEKLEATIGELHELMAQSDFYRRGGDEIAQRQRELAESERQLEAALERWAELAD